MENEGAFLLSQDQGKEFLRDHLEYFPRDLWNPEVMLAESDWEGPHSVGTLTAEERGCCIRDSLNPRAVRAMCMGEVPEHLM